MKFNLKLSFSVTIITAIVLISIFAPLIAPHDPLKVNMKNRLVDFSREHPLGTDALGRDVLSRIIYGGRASMVLALISVILSMSLGLIMGVIAGYYGGVLDLMITSVTNIFQGIPSISFMIAITGVFGIGVKSLILGILLTSWAGFSRLVRTEVLRIREEAYIEALRTLGCSNLQLIFKHIIPNMMSNLIVLFTLRIGRSILTIASLSYLGLGIAPPTADWSVMINDARMNFRSSPFLLIAPGAVIFILIWSINLLGDSLRDIFDVRNREVRL